MSQTQEGYARGFHNESQSIRRHPQRILFMRKPGNLPGRQWPVPQPVGLSKIGDNLYMETRESGQATSTPRVPVAWATLPPTPWNNPMSNLADEFVDYDIQQRGLKLTPRSSPQPTPCWPN